MKDYSLLKSQVIRHLQTVTENSVQALEKAIFSATQSRDSDNKSSAGDKYETGRAMMQNEISNLQAQLHQALETRLKLKTLENKVIKNRVENGSLVLTDNGMFFIGLGLGRIVIEGETIYAVSLEAPLGQALFQKQRNEKVTLKGREIQIQALF